MVIVSGVLSGECTYPADVVRASKDRRWWCW